VTFLVDEIRYYKGKHKVRILTESQGYWIVEALEEFQEEEDEKVTLVKVGEQKIVPLEELLLRRKLPPMVKEHEYELQMERKVKRIVANEEQPQDGKKNKEAS
jgi:Leu/Phe-tRNA-protein transferase